MAPLGKGGYIQISQQIIDEYQLFKENILILISGSRSSVGFVVSRPGLIRKSIMEGLFSNHPEFKNYSLPCFIGYKIFYGCISLLFPR